ncbi:MAG: hypothetical protein ACPHNY_03595 [Akkermansiaceae bacterium]
MKISLLCFCLAASLVHAAKPTSSWHMPSAADMVSLSWVNGPPVVQGWQPHDKSFSTFRDEHAFLALRSGHWGMLLDPRKLKIERLTGDKARDLDGMPNALDAMRAQWLPAELDLRASVDGKVYRPTGGPVDNRKPATMPVRIVESGDFFQHIAIYDLELLDDAGNKLDAKSWLEIRAWGDRCIFEWHVEPAGDAAVKLSASLGMNDTDQQQTKTANKNMVRLGVRFASGKLLPAGEKRDGITISAQTLDDFTVREPSISYSPVTDAWEVRIANQKGWPLDQGPQDDIPLYLPEQLDRVSRSSLQLENTSQEPRTIRLRLTHLYHPISGYVPMILRADGHQTGLPLQSSKNWHVKPGMPLPYDNAWINVSTLLRLEPGAKVDLRYDTIHAHWQGVPASSAAQLSLIGYDFNGFWVQMALGSWGETLCVQPGRTMRRSFITDVRPFLMRGPSGLTHDWTPNFGGGDIAKVIDNKGQLLMWQDTVTQFRMIGPNLSHVKVTELLEGGSMRMSIDSYLPRSNSAARSYFKVQLEALKDFKFEELALFQLGSDYYNEVTARTLSWGNGHKRTGSANPPLLEGNAWGRVIEPVALIGEAPWVALHGVASNDGAPVAPVRSFAVRGYSAVLGGEHHTTPHIAAARHNGGRLNAELILPEHIEQLRKGDRIEFLVQMTVFPPSAKSYYGTSKALRRGLETTPDSWELAAHEATHQAIHINGELHAFPATLTCPPDIKLQFNVESQSEMDTIQLTGLPDPELWQIGELIDGKFKPLGERFPEEADPQVNYDPVSESWTVVLSLVFPEAASLRTVVLRPTEG